MLKDERTILIQITIPSPITTTLVYTALKLSQSKSISTSIAPLTVAKTSLYTPKRIKIKSPRNSRQNHRYNGNHTREK